MLTAINLSTDQEMTFDDNCSPEWAVAYPYWTERDRTSWALSTPYEDVITATPLEYGKQTVIAGDWCAMLK